MKYFPVRFSLNIFFLPFYSFINPTSNRDFKLVTVNMPTQDRKPLTLKNILLPTHWFVSRVRCSNGSGK